MKTAIDWLIEKVHSDEYTNAFGKTYISIDLVIEAKEMEKQQIMLAHQYGAINYQGGEDNFNHFQEDNHYYNEQYYNQ